MPWPIPDYKKTLNPRFGPGASPPSVIQSPLLQLALSSPSLSGDAPLHEWTENNVLVLPGEFDAERSAPHTFGPQATPSPLFVLIPHILADNPYVDAIYHHSRTQSTLRIRQAIREMPASEGGMPPENVPQQAIDSIFTIAHLEHASGSEIYIHSKHMIVDDIWMVISSSNISRRGMSYETEIGAAISEAEVEGGVRKVVRDHRIRLWAEHLQLDRSQWQRIIDPIAGLIRSPAPSSCARASTTLILPSSHLKSRLIMSDSTTHLKTTPRTTT